MLTQLAGTVSSVVDWDADAQELVVTVNGTDHRALNYPAITGRASIGDVVLINTTAQVLNLGTGGFAFVMGLRRPDQTVGAPPAPESGHIIKGRYLPCQVCVTTLEENPEHAQVWEKTLSGMPVLAGQLHSQLIPSAAGLVSGGQRVRVVYVMTDAAALPLAFSRSVRTAKKAGLIVGAITCGQAFGGDYETVTLHSALLAAKHILHADAAVVIQGPGNAGTGTRYGFSGIEQASILDTAAALDGRPVAIVRMSNADPRPRHQGISHHTLTSLRLVRSRCMVPLPAGVDASAINERHLVRSVEDSDSDLVVDSLVERDIPLISMGRTPVTDRVFFLAAAAAGLAARDIWKGV